MKNILAENMRRFGTKNLLTEETKIGSYKVGGKKFGREEYNDTTIELYIRDSGNGEMYVQVSADGATFNDAYNKAAKDFISKRDFVKGDQQHQIYRQKNPSTAIETIQPPKLEEI